MSAASMAVRPLLTGPVRAATVVAALTSAVYLEAGPGEVLAVVGPTAVRVPLAVVAPKTPSDSGFAGFRLGDVGWVGGGAVGLQGREWRVARWWDPRVRPMSRTTAADVDHAALTALAALAATVGLDQALRCSLERGSAHAFDDCVAARVGLGPGLTPEGDDVLAGALVALAAVGAPHRPGLARAVSARLDRTTAVSAALLRAAAAGDAIPQVARFVAACLGGQPGSRSGGHSRGQLGSRSDRAVPDEAVAAQDGAVAALDALLAVGHTSGAALARGVLTAMLAQGRVTGVVAA